MLSLGIAAGADAAVPGLRDRDERSLEQRAMRALERLDCADVAQRRPTSLPFPIQKRVALARRTIRRVILIVIVNLPPIMLLSSSRLV